MPSTVRYPGDLGGTQKDGFRISTYLMKLVSNVLRFRNSADDEFQEIAAHSARFHGSNAVNYVGLTAPAGMGAPMVWTLPGADGTAGYLWSTDASGNVVLVAPATGAELVEEEAFTQATSSPLTIFAPTDNELLTVIEVDVTSAASAGGAATLSIGDSGDADKYMLATELSLYEAAVWSISPRVSVGESPDPVIATITPDGKTFAGTIRVWHVIPA
jgi:hypothetical protein